MKNKDQQLLEEAYNQITIQEGSAVQATPVEGESDIVSKLIGNIKHLNGRGNTQEAAIKTVELLKLVVSGKAANRGITIDISDPEWYEILG